MIPAHCIANLQHRYSGLILHFLRGTNKLRIIAEAIDILSGILSVLLSVYTNS